jgi:hypothetical protein
MARHQRREPFPIEATHELRDRIARPPAGATGRVGEALPVRHRQQRRRPRHPVGALTAGAGDLLQCAAFRGRQRPQGILLSLHPKA